MSRVIDHWKGIMLIACSIILSAAAQLFMKIGMLEASGIDILFSLQGLSDNVAQILPAVLWVISGLMFYVISMLVWLLILSKYELSLAYPLLSLSYVLVYIAAVLWPRLHESISVSKTFGILLILAGVYLVTYPNKD